MPPPEIVISCVGCGYTARLPMAVLQRDSSYCSQCGKRLPVSEARVTSTDPNARPIPAKARHSSRPTRRR